MGPLKNQVRAARRERAKEPESPAYKEAGVEGWGAGYGACEPKRVGVVLVVLKRRRAPRRGGAAASRVVGVVLVGTASR